MRWVRRVIAATVAMLAVSGAIASYRAYYPISSVKLRAEPGLRPGSIIRVDTASSGRGPVEIRVELLQGGQRTTVALDRVGSRNWALWDSRWVHHHTEVAVTRETLQHVVAGRAVVRATATGTRAWLREPPPVTDEMTVEVAPFTATSR
jgi:hypothetical protein